MSNDTEDWLPSLSTIEHPSAPLLVSMCSGSIYYAGYWQAGFPVNLVYITTCRDWTDPAKHRRCSFPVSGNDFGPDPNEWC